MIVNSTASQRGGLQARVRVRIAARRVPIDFGMPFGGNIADAATAAAAIHSRGMCTVGQVRREHHLTSYQLNATAIRSCLVGRPSTRRETISSTDSVLAIPSVAALDSNHTTSHKQDGMDCLRDCYLKRYSVNARSTKSVHFDAEGKGGD